MPVIYRPFLEKLGGNTNAESYVGTSGDLFYDPTTTTLRIADGSTPGGTVVSGGGDTGEWTFTADDGYNARTDADIVIQAVGSGNSAGVYWNLDPDDGSAASSTLAVQSTGLNFQHFDGTDVYALTFNQAGTLTTAGDIAMNGNMRGVARIQPENNPMAEITLPLDADADTTPLTLYSEGVGISVSGGYINGFTEEKEFTGDNSTSTVISLKNTYAVLNIASGQTYFALPDGVDGQEIKIILGLVDTGVYAFDVNIEGKFWNIAGTTPNFFPTLETGGSWVPFNNSSDTNVYTVATAIWYNGGWNISQGIINT